MKELKSRSSEVILIPTRYELLYQGLLYLFSSEMKNEITRECNLVDKIDNLAIFIKTKKDMVSFNR